MTSWEQARRANLANWDERASIHAGPRAYDLDGFVTDPERLSGVVAFDAPRLGDVRGLRLAHLQCHLGTDTLSWARLGAEVIGLDFSPAALAEARALAERAGLAARFVEGDLYEAANLLPRGTFDVVYTGVGALNWLPDMTRWAQVVAALLAPGGRLYVREMHPMLFAMDETAEDLVARHPYFETGEPIVWDDPTTYADPDARVANARTYEWSHSLGEILTAVLDAGLRVTGFTEHRFLDWAHWPWMERDSQTGQHVLPAALRDRVALMFTLQAARR